MDALLDSESDSDSIEGALAGRILAGMLGGQVQHDTVHDTSSADVPPDSDYAEGELAGRILAALLGGGIQRDEVGPPPEHLAIGSGHTSGDSDSDFEIPLEAAESEVQSDIAEDALGPQSAHANDDSESDFNIPISSGNEDSISEAGYEPDSDIDMASKAVEAMVGSDSSEYTNQPIGGQSFSTIGAAGNFYDSDSDIQAQSNRSDIESVVSAITTVVYGKVNDDPPEASDLTSEIGDEVPAIEAIVPIPGPFTADYFNRVRSEWMHPTEDDLEMESD